MSLLLLDSSAQGKTYPQVTDSLTVDQMVFRSGGELFRWKSTSAFLLFIRWVQPQQEQKDTVNKFLDWVQETGFNTVRVFISMSIVPPKRGLPEFILDPDELALGLELLKSRGLRCSICAGDMQILMPEWDEQEEYFQSLAPVRDSYVGCTQEYWNEPWKNGGHVEKIHKMGTNLQASGNYTLDNKWEGQEPDKMLQVMPGVLDFFTTHCARKEEWVRLPHEMEELYDGWHGTVDSGEHKGEPEYFAGVKVPVIEDEPVGFSEVADPYSRSASKEDAFDFAAGCALFGAGCTYHCDDGVNTVVPGPVQQECAKHWVQGMNLIRLDAPFGSYTRGGLSSCPLVHSDDLALRTYAKILGNEAESIVVRPQPGWQAIAANGWTITGQAGDRGNVVYLKR